MSALEPTGTAPLPRASRLLHPSPEDGWVSLLDNPAHKRSKLVSATQKGRAKIRRMLEQEQLVLASLELRNTKEEVIRAAEVLHEMRAVLEDLRTSARDD